MSFITLLYHEIRKKEYLPSKQPSPIVVRQDYEDFLPPILFVTLEAFQEQMAFLHHHNYHTLTLKEIYAFYDQERQLPEKSVLITFDDCFQSLAQYAYPILKKYGFKAAAFVVTGWLNDEAKPYDPNKSICLTSTELAVMTDVFEYANHTHSFHTRETPSINKAMATDDLSFRDDLDLCNQHPLISAPETFAYTFGLYNEANIDVLKDKGFKLAFTTQNGENTLNTDPLLLRRNVVTPFMDMTAFKQLLNQQTPKEIS